MLSISIEKQRKRRPFFKLRLTDEYAGGRSGGQGQPSQTEIYHRIVYFYCFKCFVLVLKSKGNTQTPTYFSNFLWRTDNEEPAGGGARLDKQKYFIGLFISIVSNALD